MLAIPNNCLEAAGNDIVVPIMLNATGLYRGHISTVQPRSVENNVSFIVDLDCLEDPEDLLSDDLGSWVQSRTSTNFYSIEKDKGGIVTNVRSGSSHEIEETIKVTRRPFINKSDCSLKKTVVNIEDFNLVYVVYSFIGEGHAIKVKPHGNSKINLPFIRTYKSTKAKLSAQLSRDIHSNNAKTYFSVSNDIGGIKVAQAPGQLPRNLRQVKYVKETLRDDIKDPLYDITTYMKENREDKFIRTYSLDDASPKVVLFTDGQLDDLVNFCCNERNGFKSLMYADITFNLGPFFLLVIAYKNTLLFTKNTETCPAMLGPMMLCLLKDEETYVTMFQKLTAKIPGLHFLQGYCTDSEKALRNSLARQFPFALQFLCWIHARRNIRDQCSRKFKLSSRLTQEIITDIFSDLVSFKDRKHFNERAEELKEKWDRLEKQERTGSPKFSTYFTKYKQNDIRDYMRVSMAEKAGYGSCLQSTNVPESINAVIKRWRNFEATNMLEFVTDIRKLVEKQKDDVNRAFMCLDSPYTVRKEFQAQVVMAADVFQSQERGNTKRLIPVVDQLSYDRVKNYKPAPYFAMEDHDSEQSNSPEVSISQCSQPDANDDFDLLRKVFSPVDV